ncbi:hypothetical protein EJB05_38300, partial [Eragrostis curvula]
MVPARNLHLVRDAHGAAPFLGVTTAPPPPPSLMAQEPLDQRYEPSKLPPPPPPQERLQESRHGHVVEAAAEQQLPPRPLQPAGGAVANQQEAAGTSGSSSGRSSGNGGAGDWLRLGLAPSSPGGGAASRQLDVVFADRAGPMLQSQPRPELQFLRPAVPGIPQASITLPAPRAGPPWMPPWSTPAPPLLPFAHRTFYTPGAGASGIDTMIRVVLPPTAVAAAAGVWFALQAAPHQGREPFLPQIPRSYLRIKDVRVTVGLLIKYLVSKLGLEDESEVFTHQNSHPLNFLNHLQFSFFALSF